MARQQIRVRIAALENYLSKKESIVDVVLFVLENHDLQLFTRVRSAAVKENVIVGIEDMWDRAAEQAKGDLTQTKRTIQIVREDLRHARTCLALGVCNFYGKLSYNWKIFRMNREKLPLIDVLALHIAEHGNNAEEKEELLQQLKQRIVTGDDMALKLSADEVRSLVSKECPVGVAYLPENSLSYLGKLCHKFKVIGYPQKHLINAWEAMLEKKARQVNSSDWKGLLGPEDALYVLFEQLDYNEVKKHYTAYLSFINKSL